MILVLSMIKISKNEFVESRYSIVKNTIIEGIYILFVKVIYISIIKLYHINKIKSAVFGSIYSICLFLINANSLNNFKKKTKINH